MSDDPKISQRYRELPREEPPRHLDAAILAAARRATEKGTRRWYVPLATAAIIVLAVAVTVHVERQQQTESELAEAPATAPVPARAEKSGAKREEPAADSLEFRAQRDAPAAEAQPRAAPAPGLRQDEELRAQLPQGQRAPAPEAPAPQAKVAQPKTKAELRRSDEAAPAASILGKVSARSPEQWLQGIADLRRQGRHDEADRELAEFRRQHPGYRLSEEMRAKVEGPGARAR